MSKYAIHKAMVKEHGEGKGLGKRENWDAHLIKLLTAKTILRSPLFDEPRYYRPEDCSHHSLLGDTGGTVPGTVSEDPTFPGTVPDLPPSGEHWEQ